MLLLGVAVLVTPALPKVPIEFLTSGSPNLSRVFLAIDVGLGPDLTGVCVMEEIGDHLNVLMADTIDIREPEMREYLDWLKGHFSEDTVQING